MNERGFIILLLPWACALLLALILAVRFAAVTYRFREANHGADLSLKEATQKWKTCVDRIEQFNKGIHEAHNAMDSLKVGLPETLPEINALKVFIASLSGAQVAWQQSCALTRVGDNVHVKRDNTPSEPWVTWFRGFHVSFRHSDLDVPYVLIREDLERQSALSISIEENGHTSRGRLFYCGRECTKQGWRFGA